MAVSGRKAGLSPSILAGSEELHDIFCEPCSNDGQHLPADGYCEDCREYLCATCIKYHGKVTATKQHVIWDKKNIPTIKPSTAAAKNDTCTDPCPNHSSKNIEYYCQTHDQLGCSACVTINHRNCTDVDFILDLVDGIETSPEYIELLRTCNDLETDVERNRLTADNNTTLVNKYGDEAIKQIRMQRHEINTIFDKLESEISEKVLKVKNEDTVSIKSVREECNAASAKIKPMTDHLMEKQDQQQRYQLFVSMKKAETDMKLLQNKVKQIEKGNAVRQYRFEPDKLVDDMKQNLIALGNILIETQDTVTAANPKLSTEPNQPTSKKESHIPHSTSLMTASSVKHRQVRKATFYGEINVKTDTDKKQPEISGLVLLPGDQLVVVDYINESIKCVNVKTKQVTSELAVPYPYDITSINQHQLAVTLFTQNIQFISLAGTLSRSHFVKVGGICSGITHDQGRLLVTFTEPPKLEIMKLDGTVLKRFSVDPEGKDLFNIPRYVIKYIDDTIFVSDFTRYTATNLTMDGEIKKTFSDEPAASGMTLDNFGCVYICNRAEKTIKVLLPDSDSFHELLTNKDGLLVTNCIEHCSREDKLYVGMKCDSVKIYKLT